MPKEILIYNIIFDFIAEQFMMQMEEFKDEDLVIRVNSPGGSVFAGWGMVAKTLEHKGKITIKVDGQADSMAAAYLLFHEEVRALNVSKFLLHRASVFSTDPADLARLEDINKDFRAAFESKLDIAKFEEISGVTIDEFFNSDGVIDVMLNADQAKEIKLISHIDNLEDMADEIQALNLKFVALSSSKKEIKKKKTEDVDNNNPNKPKSKMTLKEIKAAHPEAFNEIREEGYNAGVTEERDRACVWLAYVDADVKAVSEGIKEGKILSASGQAELNRAAFVAQSKDDAKGDSPGDTPTDQVPDADKGDGKTPKAVSDFETELVADRKE